MSDGQLEAEQSRWGDGGLCGQSRTATRLIMTDVVRPAVRFEVLPTKMGSNRWPKKVLML